MTTFRAGVLLVGLLCVGSCRTPVDNEYLRWAAMPYEGAATDTLGEGDKIAIRVYQEPDMSGEYIVPRSGAVQFPLIGEISLMGRACADIADEINARLRDGYIRDPSVSCQVEEVNSLAVVVSGEVQTPGVFPFANDMTVVAAVALAEGLTANAAEDRVVVTREIDGETREIVIPFKQVVSGRAPNFRLWPGDSVFVPAFRLIP